MRDKIRVIDGTDKEPAPAPSRGWMRAVFHVIEANTGWNSIKDIQELLPAELATEELVPEDRVRKTCSNLLAQGYVVRNQGKYRVAPQTFYDMRQAERQEMLGTRGPMKRERKKRTGEVIYLARPYWHWTTLGACCAVSAALGFVVAMIINTL